MERSNEQHPSGNRRFELAVLAAAGFLAVLGVSIALLLPVDRRIWRIDWGDLLGPYTLRLNVIGYEDFAHETHLDFYWNLLGGPVTKDDAFSLSVRISPTIEGAVGHLGAAERSRFPPAPEHSQLRAGEDSFGVSLIESTFTKAFLFRRRNVSIWMYHHTNDSAKLRAVVILIDEAIRDGRFVRERGPPRWRYWAHRLGLPIRLADDWTSRY